MTMKVKTRILVLSDTHAALPQTSDAQDCAYRVPLPQADVAIHTGDLTMTGTLREHQKALDLLSSIAAPLKIVIPGNHDVTLDREYFRTSRWNTRMKCSDEELDESKSLYTSETTKSRGIHYIEEGLCTFKLANGASLTVYASGYTPEFCGWAFAYPRSEDRYNTEIAINPIPTSGEPRANAVVDCDMKVVRDVDILMTHGPPYKILDETTGGEEVGCEHLMKAVSRCRPLLHCFGHIHEAWGAQRKTWPRSSHTTTQQDSTTSQRADTITALETTRPSLNKQGEGSSPHQWQKCSSPDTKQLKVSKAAMRSDRGVIVDAINITKGAETLFINASIMSRRYKPLQGPWVVDLLLDEQ